MSCTSTGPERLAGMASIAEIAEFVQVAFTRQGDIANPKASGVSIWCCGSTTSIAMTCRGSDDCSSIYPVERVTSRSRAMRHRRRQQAER